MTLVSPYAPGLMQITFSAQRQDAQKVIEGKNTEAIAFAVVARIVIPTAEIAGLVELLTRQAAREREVAGQLMQGHGQVGNA